MWKGNNPDLTQLFFVHYEYEESMVTINSDFGNVT